MLRKWVRSYAAYSKIASDMKMMKPYVQQLLAADQVGEALEYLLVVDAPVVDADFRTQVILQSSQYRHYEKLVRDNTEDFADLVRTRNKATLALLQLSEALPDDLPLPTLPPKAQAPQGVSENKLKARLLWLLATAKIAVLGFTYTLWQSGSFTNEQYMATAGLLVPIFVAYLSLLVKDQTERRHAIAHPDKHVTRTFERMVYGMVIAYIVVLLLILNLRGPGTISFTQMNALLALAESGLGVYVTQVVFGMLKKA